MVYSLISFKMDVFAQSAHAEIHFTDCWKSNEVNSVLVTCV